MTIYSNDLDEPTVSVLLSGSGLVPDIEIPVTSYDFDTVAVHTSAEWNLLIENVGGADLIVTDVRSDNAAFTATLTLPLIIAPRSSEHVPITFAPTDQGAYTGRLTVTSDDPDEPNVSITLSGEGIGVAVQLKSFDILTHQGIIFVRWSIGAARDCLGFHLYRGTSPDKGYEQLTHFLIPVIVHGSYTFRDGTIAAGNTYYYRLEAIDLKGQKEDMGCVSVNVADLTPSDFGLAQNCPNPFNPNTRFNYILPESDRATLSIFNTLGQKVRTLVDDTQSSGFYTVFWDGRDDLGREISSGVYIAVLRSGAYMDSRKMILLK